MALIVLATFGSYGDVFPYLAIGDALVRRGHEAVIAAPSTYRAAVEKAGLHFAAVRPDVDYSDIETFRRVMEPKRGAEVLVRELLVPHLRESYTDLEAACRGADLLLSHVLTYAAPILGEKLGLPWLSTVLSPMVFCSSHDPPALAPVPGFARLRFLGPSAVGVLLRVMKRVSWGWSAPIRSFRRELGLGADADPLWEGQFSPHGTLALFSNAIARPQPDWPARTTLCGFPFHDDDYGGDADADRLQPFLAEGPAPLVFTLGSSAVMSAGNFYAQAVEATKRLRQRAVLVVGDVDVPDRLPPEVLAIRSTAVQPLFDAAAVIVHAGGIGSVGQALRAGRPQLVVPFAADQFDNALRVQRTGVGLRLDRSRCSVSRIADAIERLLTDGSARSGIATAAAEVGSDRGAEAACEAIEALLTDATGRG